MIGGAFAAERLCALGQLGALFVGALARRTHAAVFADNYWLSFDCRIFYSRKVEMYGSFIHAEQFGDPPQAQASLAELSRRMSVIFT